MAYEVRAFKASDKPQVLQIARRTWGGHDHLPHVIDKWIADPKGHLYVAEYRGRVVSVANLKVIEEGRTGWMEGLRVHPRYRRRGLGALMTQHLVKVSSEIGVARLRLSAAMDNKPSVKLAREIGMSERFRMSVLWKGVDEAKVWEYDPVQINKIDANRAFDVLQATPSLLPGNVVLYYWYALDATLDNLREIGEVASFWVGLRDGRTVSFSISLPAEEGDERVWCSTVYAADLDAFLSNLYHHLGQAKARNIAILMCIHQVAFEAAYKQVSWLKRGGHRMRLALFEKNFVTAND